MTTQEFFNYASNKPLYDLFHGSYKKDELYEMILKNYSSGSKPEKIVEFFLSVGRLAFERDEKKSDDTLTIDLRYMIADYFWKDIGWAVNAVCLIHGLSGVIEKLYISEQGKFYNQNHVLVAETKEDFFDYLTTVEFDYHPEITQRTYDMLKHVGWYEGRRVDVTEFNLEMKQRGIVLTKNQLDFLSEFSGLDFIFDNDSWQFWSLKSITQNYKPLFIGSKQQRNVMVVGENIFQCGNTMGSDIYLCANGLLTTRPEHPLGRTTMECVNHLCNFISDNSKWLDEEDD